jgi:multisubunit Na+/H+ antiporter MnhE subunit
MRLLAELVVWWAVLLGVWLMSLNAFSYAELLTATALALPCAFAARAARIAASGRWRVRAGSVRWPAHLPWAVAHDTVAVLRLAAEPDRPDDDSFDDVALDHDCEALATTVVSGAPGSVVVDAQNDRLLVHRLPIGETGLSRAVRG